MISFTKMEGLGNDYVYVDATKMDDCEISHLISKTSFISDRHFGVGSDGLVLICKSEKEDFKMRMFNQDGTEAEMCGNAIRCIGKYVYERGLTTKTNLEIETLGGVKKLELFLGGDGKVETISVNMGKPIFDPKKIPVDFDEVPVKHLQIRAIDKMFNFTVEKYGSILEVDRHFPKKMNIEFIEVIDRNTVKMRVWERGSGETLACRYWSICSMCCMYFE